MTAEQRFDRELPEILADLYPVSTPDYRLDLVRQIVATRQRPAWALPERWIPMTAIALGRSVRPVPWRTIGVVALLLLSIAVVAIIAGSQRRLPPPFGPAANGDLVVAEDGDIFLIDSATGVKTLAIGGPAEDTEPLFSRDGTHIAFFRRTDRVNGLWLADAEGRDVHQLSTGSLFDFSQIEWSPDGTSILLTTSVDGGGAPAIVPTDGSVEEIVETGMPVEGPVWLPTGEILFRGLPQTGAGLFATRPDGSALRTIVEPTGALQWDAQFYAPSPDGSEVAYQWRPAPTTPMFLYVVPAMGGTPRAITSVESVNPIWSPDGTWIAFWTDEGSSIVRADGTTPAHLAVPIRGSIRWAPDSSRLLVQADEGAAVLIDPFGGPEETVPWSSIEFPDWQRLAPPTS